MKEIERLEQRYEGKAKRVYATNQSDLFIVEYKDDATAFNGQKKAQLGGKGVVNNAITSRLYPLLEQAGIPTHFVEQLSEREQLVKSVQIIPAEVIIRNIAAGSFAKRLNILEGTPLHTPLFELSFKDDALGDPLVPDGTFESLGLASSAEMQEIRRLALAVNVFLSAFFLERGLKLVDFKLEFGRLPDGTIVLADEISPDTCRLWDSQTDEKMDKDRFRRDLGGVEEAYQEVLARVMK